MEDEELMPVKIVALNTQTDHITLRSEIKRGLGVTEEVTEMWTWSQ